MDNKLDLIWITDMITNKITDRITDKITDMTSKLQMLITFATVIRLRPTIYQNAQNSEENLDKGIWYTIFCQKDTSKCLNFVFKDQTPNFFFQNFCNFFFTQSVKDTRNKNKNVTRTRTRTRTQITEQGQKHKPRQITKKKKNRIG